MDIFETCGKINSLLVSDNENEARDVLIKLLNFLKINEIPYDLLINHLIRETGLYPYLNYEQASWQDRFVYEAFKVDVGGGNVMTLHREQSSLLKKLINGSNIAVSAPTSFGKSFVIDAFIALSKPKNVVVIVPTIALTDETRRRIFRKFSNEYKIITTTDVELSNKNIFIFPQERAISYIGKIKDIDILIIDEFYKISSDFDKERSPILLKALIKLGKIAKQKYFLAPNITHIKDNIFTKDVIFEDKLNFNTVFLDRINSYENINGDEIKKSDALVSILINSQAKSLIYAGNFSNIEKVGNLLLEKLDTKKEFLLLNFSNWLSSNYDINWKLSNLVKRGVGIHNGQLHRSISQIQIKLFEEVNGLNTIISTSSIVEGVNTSAENVIIWKNKDGNHNLNEFTFKNIIGRSGRMFKHFVGKVYLLEKPPIESQTQLNITFSNSIVGDLDEEIYKDNLSKEHIDKIVSFKKEMFDLLGKEKYIKLLKQNVFQNSDSEFIKSLATDMLKNPSFWKGLGTLNSNNPNDWKSSLLYRIWQLQKEFEVKYGDFLGFLKILTNNWIHPIPILLQQSENLNVGIDRFFKLERIISFKFSSIANDVNILQKEILDYHVDISPFVSRLSHVFLPSVVYQLEEYGLPRMISRKLHLHGIINFEDEHLTIHSVIEFFNNLNKDELINSYFLDDFDKYILRYFIEGITYPESYNTRLDIIDI
ncbi:DEAD/DEAH box helicase [Siphonobacter sp. SORGH_AS_0500]|uniref:DEAD/DEAH box helicase n=1 Tax=Siphonobacter sp. SORGH_AS_0500 TaxID=1864824 RepID=UPI0028546306|nr:DEAD/DEAH box helicase [Siphonobacter sp. SORGH_AS_0500]MDR6194705.1 hypothetical protein [Siphonobacter sp. SORGH_AS_0500]